MKLFSSIPRRIRDARTTFPDWRISAGLAALALMLPGRFLTAADGPVAAVQEELKKQQYFFEEPNGRLDEATHAALRRFQIRHGLPATAELDAVTIDALWGGRGLASPELHPRPSESFGGQTIAAAGDKGERIATEKPRREEAVDSSAHSKPAPQLYPPPAPVRTAEVDPFASEREPEIIFSSPGRRDDRNISSALGGSVDAESNAGAPRDAVLVYRARTTTPNGRTYTYEKRTIAPSDGTRPESVEPRPREDGFLYRLFHRRTLTNDN